MFIFCFSDCFEMFLDALLWIKTQREREREGEIVFYILFC